jgi:squalene synthase HpnC
VAEQHYENFPVASLLCPAPLRAPIKAIYRFARTADDIADEGPASPAQRFADLSRYRQALHAAAAGQAASADAWPLVFEPLAAQIAHHQLPLQLLEDLLDAFVIDVGNPVYANRAELLGYCARSAHPIGRLLLHLYGVTDATALQRSDAICAALQLINFWQDLSVDLPRGRVYVPVEDAAAHGLRLRDLALMADNTASRKLVADLVGWAVGLMNEGAPLALSLPGRVGWELRFVVQGGLRIAKKIAALDHATIVRRPRLSAFDAPLLLWRAVTMRSQNHSHRR